MEIDKCNENKRETKLNIVYNNRLEYEKCVAELTMVASKSVCCSLWAGKASMMMLLFTKHLIIDFDRGAIGQNKRGCYSCDKEAKNT